MSTEENKAVVRRILEEVWNKGNLSVVDGLFAADYVDHNPLPTQAPDREGLKQAVSVFHTGFSGIQFDIDVMIAEGDKIASRGTFRGTHTGEFAGASATGKEITMSWIIILRIENGKVVERWIHSNELDFLTQLGVIPPME